MQKVMPACGLTDPATWPNSCLLNCYSDGTETIDWHSDDEPLFAGKSKEGERIILLALGSERIFEVRPSNKSLYEDVPLTLSLRVKGGDMWSLEGHTAKHYMHRIPKQGADKSGPVRLHVNLTWRWIVSHKCGK